MLNEANDRLEVTPLLDEPAPARAILTSKARPAGPKSTPKKK